MADQHARARRRMAAGRGLVITLVAVLGVAVVAGLATLAWHTARHMLMGDRGPQASALWVALPCGLVLLGGALATVCVAIAEGREKAGPGGERPQLVPRVWQGQS